MKVLHVAPGDSAGGSLILALRLAGEDGENVLSCMDNFSCGPISPLTPAARSRWWGQFWEGYATPEAEGRLAEFWKRLDAWDGKLVFWFGLRSAAEVALLHVLADRLKERPVFLADVTGHRYAYPGVSMASRRSAVLRRPRRSSNQKACAVFWERRGRPQTKS